MKIKFQKQTNMNTSNNVVSPDEDYAAENFRKI